MIRIERLQWTVLLPLVLLAGIPAHADIAISLEFADDGVSSLGDFYSWSGSIAAESTDFAGGQWAIEGLGSNADWFTADDGFAYWWEIAVPGTFYVESGTEWLLGDGTFTAVIYAADDSYASIDAFGSHLLALGEWDGAFTSGNIDGEPAVIGGTFSMSAATLDAATLTLSGGVPAADGQAAFDAMWPGPVLVGNAAVPEPATLLLFAGGAGVLGFLKRRQRK